MNAIIQSLFSEINRPPELVSCQTLASQKRLNEVGHVSWTLTNNYLE